MAYFAEINASGVVQRVIVADQAFIDSGAVGNAANWVETFMDGSSRKNYAGIGYTYDATHDHFAPPQPFLSWTLDLKTALWVSPVPMPPAVVGAPQIWNETLKQWQVSPLAVAVNPII